MSRAPDEKDPEYEYNFQRGYYDTQTPNEAFRLDEEIIEASYDFLEWPATVKKQEEYKLNLHEHFTKESIFLLRRAGFWICECEECKKRT